MASNRWSIDVPSVGEILTREDMVNYWDRRGKLVGYLSVAPHDWRGNYCLLLLLTFELVCKVEEILRGHLRRARIRGMVDCLDLGGGFGRISVHMAAAMPRTRFEIHDLSRTMLHRAEYLALAMEVNDRIKTHVGDVSEILIPRGPYHYGQFPVIIAGALFLHLIEDAEVIVILDQVKAILAAGGLLILFETMLDNNEKYQTLPDGLKHGLTRYRWLRQFDEWLSPLIRIQTAYQDYCGEIVTITAFIKPRQN